MSGTRADYDHFYTYLMGPNVANRPTKRPSLDILKRAEDSLWVYVARHMHENEDLKLGDGLNCCSERTECFHVNIHSH